MATASAAVGELEQALGPAVAENAARAEVQDCWQKLAVLIKEENKQLDRLYGVLTKEEALSLRVAE